MGEFSTIILKNYKNHIFAAIIDVQDRMNCNQIYSVHLEIVGESTQIVHDAVVCIALHNPSHSRYRRSFFLLPSADFLSKIYKKNSFMAEFFLITLRTNVIHFALKTSEVKYNCETADK